jgi:branched-chain amino acid transport system substrate-binding protein
MRRQLLAWAVALGVAIAVPAWAADRAVDEVVRLGFATALSGPYAATGERDRNAFEAALDDLNANGGVLGHRVEGVVVDDACGIEEAVAAARTLIEAGVAAVIGHMCSHSSLMAAGLYEAAEIPMLTPFSTHPRLTQEGRPNVFRLIGRDDDQGAFVANHVHQSWPERRLAIVHDGSTYGQGLAGQMRLRLRRLGGEEVLHEQYTPGAEAYDDLAATLDQAGAEVVFIGGYGPDAGRIVRAARERGLEAQFLGGDGLDMEGFWATAGEAGEGTLFSDRPIADFDDVSPDLIASLEAHGVSRHPSELGTYAAVQTWAEAVRRAGSFALRPVTRELNRGRFDTLLGVLAFNARGDLRSASWEWRAWSDGRHAPVDSAPPT